MIIVAEFSVLDVCGGPGHASRNGKSATWKKCNWKKLQHAKGEKREEYKTEKLQRVKVQHEIVQYTKGVQHGKKVQHEKIFTQKSANNAVWEKFNMKKYKLPQWNTEKVHKNSAL